MNDYCFVCGGKGFEDKVCPSCGREPLKISINLDRKKDPTEFIQKVEGVDIPNYYHGVFWSRARLEGDNKEKLPSKFDKESSRSDDKLFIRYCEQLDKINSIFVDKLIPHKSVIIVAPAGFSKITFAYSCMQRALDAGYTVAPLLDTVEAKRALVLASENCKYKINKSISYDDWIMSDVMFITVSKLYVHNEAYQVIEELFDRRSRKGLSTIFLSRISVDDLGKYDRTGNFSAVFKNSEDNFKYPAVIQYLQKYR